MLQANKDYFVGIDDCSDSAISDVDIYLGMDAKVITFSDGRKRYIDFNSERYIEVDSNGKVTHFDDEIGYMGAKIKHLMSQGV